MEPTQLRNLMAEWVNAIDPEAEVRYRRQIARDAFDRGLDAGYAAGYEQAITEIKAVQQDLVHLLGDLGDTLRKRWRLCCPRCKQDGPRTNCADCHYRTRATFSDPRPGDFQGRQADGQAAA